MGTIAADQVVERAATLLRDKTSKTWPVPTLLGWENDGVLAILQYRPDAYTAVRVIQLATGTRQTIPAADLRLLDIPRNMGQDGQTPGLACRYVDRKQLDLSNPGWNSAAASATVRHWMYDQNVPKTFWCYPPQPASGRGYVELDVSAVPAPMTISGISGASATSVLPIDDIWLNPLLQFTVYRAYSEDSEYTQAGGKAELAYREFLQVMGVKTTVAQRFDPSKNQPPRYNAPPKSDAQGAFGTP
jgi:hypothetical protein